MPLLPTRCTTTGEDLLDQHEMTLLLPIFVLLSHDWYKLYAIDIVSISEISSVPSWRPLPPVRALGALDTLAVTSIPQQAMSWSQPRFGSCAKLAWSRVLRLQRTLKHLPFLNSPTHRISPSRADNLRIGPFKPPRKWLHRVQERCSTQSYLLIDFFRLSSLQEPRRKSWVVAHRVPYPLAGSFQRESRNLERQIFDLTTGSLTGTCHNQRANRYLRWNTDMTNSYRWMNWRLTLECQRRNPCSMSTRRENLQRLTPWWVGKDNSRA